MDTRGLSSSLFSSSASADMAFLNERQFGFWKSDAKNDHHGESFSRDKLASTEFQIPRSIRQSHLWDSCTLETEKATQYPGKYKTIPQYESSLFSSSLSEVFSTKLKLSGGSAEYSQSIDDFASHFENKEPYESLEDIEAQTIGNLLPRDDDFIAQMSDQQGPFVEELDLFSSVGGMDLGDDEFPGITPNYPVRCSVKNGEQLPSRTLLVTNISSSIEDFELRDLFEQFGSIRALSTATKHQGFVMVSYFDIRAARDAMESVLQKNLTIHYCIPKPSDSSLDQATVIIFDLDPFVPKSYLQKIFGSYGDIREIRDIPGRNSCKVIEYYDIRSAEAVLLAFNKNGITKRQIHIQPGSSVPSIRCRPIIGDDIDSRVTIGTSSAGQIFVEPIYYHGISTALNGSLLRHEQVRTQAAVPESVHMQKFDLHGFGSVRQTSCSETYPHNAWSNSNFQDHLNMMWPNTPSFCNEISMANTTKVNDHLRASPQILNTPATHLNNHHIVSAPTVIPSLWDRRHSLMARSLEVSGSHPGSLGNIRINKMLHSMDPDSQKKFPKVSGNVTDLSVGSKSLEIKSQKSGFFSGSTQMNSFQSVHERARNRRNEGSIVQGDKKHYELNVERILKGEDNRTTLMIKNIPNKYTSKMLLCAIDEHHKGTYDFIYLPIDFKNKCNVGYAFINMIDPGKIIPFYKSFNGKKWEKFNSEKVATLAYARIQGKPALVAHFRNSSLMNEDKRCRPILFDTDGPNAGDQVPFPTGPGARTTRSTKTLSAANGEEAQR